MHDDSRPMTRPDRLRATALLNGGLGLMAIGTGAILFSLATGSVNLPLYAGPLAWMIAAYHGAFHVSISRDEFRVLPITALSTLGASLTASAVGSITQTLEVTLVGFVVGALVTGCSLLGGIVLGRKSLQVVWGRGQFRSTAVVAGNGSLTEELALELTHRNELGIDVVDRVELSDDDLANGDVSMIFGALQRHQPDRLIIGEIDLREESLLPAVRFAGTIGTRVYVLPRFFSMGVGNPLFAPDQLRGFPLQRVNRPAHPRLALAVKRGLDILLSAGALLVLSPLLITVGIMVKLTSPGPLLFWQERLGQNGQTIRIPKFRSMRTSATSDFEWTADNRVTWFGRFLRRSAIDEIPQLWSVVRGDMSLVGPRPERPAFASQFGEELAEYHSRLRMRAGLTGHAQIAGLRGDTSISERAKYDNLYIDQWSLAGDLVILARTVGAVVGERRRVEAQLDFEAALLALSNESSPTADRFVIDARPALEVAEASPNSIHA